MSYVVDGECYACDLYCCLVGYDRELSNEGRHGSYVRPMYQVLHPDHDYWTDAVRWPIQDAYLLEPVIVNGKELE